MTITGPVRIGLTVSYSKFPPAEADVARLQKYIAVVEAAGAELIPLFLDEYEARAEEVADGFDGLLLAGGADLPTSWYRQDPLPGAGLELVSERRPLFENAVVERFLVQDKPVLGICYGCQFLNVYRGGALFQDIDLQVPAPIAHADGAIHEVVIQAGSRLRQIVGETRFEVPSYHHQAVSTPAPDATIVSLAPDGVVEALEWPGERFLIGLQWHPERAPASGPTQRLMAAFVGACRS